MPEKLNYRNLIPENGNVIAEIACGHEGSFNRAKQLIEAVAKSGTNLVKYQVFFTSERAKKGEREWEIFDRLTFSETDWGKVIEYSRNAGLSVLADVYGYRSFKLALSLGVDGFKIHSEDLLNSFFIKDVISHGKPTLLGVGGSKRKELYELMTFLNDSDQEHSIVLMPGVQTFPTPLEAHSIQEVAELIEKYSARYHVKVGFADHVAGDSEDAAILPLMAIASGAVLIEKHLTIDRKKKWVDYNSALNADEFEKFVKKVKKLAPLLARSEQPTPAETSYRKMFKKTLFVKRQVDAGRKITQENIGYIKNVKASVPLSAIEVTDSKADRKIPAGVCVNGMDIGHKVGAIIVARMNSARMYGKALLEIAGKESIRRVIDRARRINGIESIILATSTDTSDDALARIAESEDILLYRGSLYNVAERFFKAAGDHGLDHFVRITGDAILLDNVMIDRAIESHLRSANDVTFIRNMPFGTNKEIISLSTIKAIFENALVPENTEYLEYYLQNRKVFNVGYVVSNYKFDRSMRLTLDYREDLEFFNRVFLHFDNKNPNFNLKDAIDFLNNNQKVVDINSHKKQKFSSRELDTTLTI